MAAASAPVALVPSRCGRERRWRDRRDAGRVRRDRCGEEGREDLLRARRRTDHEVADPGKLKDRRIGQGPRRNPFPARRRDTESCARSAGLVDGVFFGTWFAAAGAKCRALAMESASGSRPVWAVMRPDRTASRRVWYSRSFWSAWAAEKSAMALSKTSLVSR